MILRDKRPETLGPAQLKWLDANLCLGKYRDYREQAERAKADTEKSRQGCKCGEQA